MSTLTSSNSDSVETSTFPIILNRLSAEHSWPRYLESYDRIVGIGFVRATGQHFCVQGQRTKVVAELEKGLPHDANHQTTLALLQSHVKTELMLSRVRAQRAFRSSGGSRCTVQACRRDFLPRKHRSGRCDTVVWNTKDDRLLVHCRMHGIPSPSHSPSNAG